MSTNSSKDPGTPKQRIWHRVAQRIQDAVAEDAGRRLFGTYVALGAICLGIVILAFALVRFIAVTRGIGLVVPGATLIVAGVTALVAQLGLSSWSEQRQRDREAKEYEHREAIYEAIAQFMVARFTRQGYDKAMDAKLRATAALWASPATVQSLAQWQQGLTKVLDAGKARAKAAGQPESNLVELNPEEELQTLKLLGLAIQSMREDLATETNETASVSVLLKSIFNQELPDDISARD